MYTSNENGIARLSLTEQWIVCSFHSFPWLVAEKEVSLCIVCDTVENLRGGRIRGKGEKEWNCGGERETDLLLGDGRGKGRVGLSGRAGGGGGGGRRRRGRRREFVGFYVGEGERAAAAGARWGEGGGGSYWVLCGRRRWEGKSGSERERVGAAIGRERESEGGYWKRERGWLCLCVKNEGRRGAVSGATRPRWKGVAVAVAICWVRWERGFAVCWGEGGGGGGGGVFGGEGDGGVTAAGARGTMTVAGRWREGDGGVGGRWREGGRGCCWVFVIMREGEGGRRS